jgi:alanine dehydrogenase
MNIGTVTEIKTHEYRVGLTPAACGAYVSAGHRVWVQSGAGINAGFTDGEYSDVGATVVDDPARIFDSCDMIVKVKEPQPSEYGLFREGQILYTYLHLAAEETLTRALLDARIKAVAYETIETHDGNLPCLKPMSEIAGRMSVQEGAKYLERPFGGRGVLLGGVPGVKRGRVVILGGGVVGTNACKMAAGLGADVTILDLNPARLEYLDDIFGGKVTTLYSTPLNIAEEVVDCDLLIGAVLIHGAKAPHLITRDHLTGMRDGSVIIDVSVDQGGCVQTSRPTTHDDPTFEVDGVVHYCVANMPGAVPVTSTMALTSTTLPYGLSIANTGLEETVKKNSAVAKGLNIYNGKCTYPDVASVFGMEYVPPEKALP